MFRYELSSIFSISDIYHLVSISYEGEQEGVAELENERKKFMWIYIAWTLDRHLSRLDEYLFYKNFKLDGERICLAIRTYDTNNCTFTAAALHRKERDADTNYEKKCSGICAVGEWLFRIRDHCWSLFALSLSFAIHFSSPLSPSYEQLLK